MIARVWVVVLLAVLGACWPATAGAMPSPNPEEHPFAITPGSFHFTTSSSQAAAHSDWTTSFDFNHNASERTFGDVRDTIVELPAGFDASSTAVPTCTSSQLVENAGARSGVANCPIGSQVGKISIDISAGPGAPAEVTVPVYNMEVTSFGVAAELGFKTSIVTQILTVAVRPGDLGLTVTAHDIAKTGEARKISVTTWGIPAAHEHDAERGEACGVSDEHPPICQNEFGGPQPANIQPKPFLANPSGCGMFTAKMEADSWEELDNWTRASDEVGPIGECEYVPFQSSLEARPTTLSAESPSGLALSLLVPQTWENPFTIATSNLKDTTVALPEGMTANAGLAEGLAACTPQQYASETSSSPPGAGCPDESKIGSITIETPLLDEKILGAVYIATPYDNVSEFGDAEHPGGSLLALYIVAKNPKRGILVKLAGEIEPNPVTGQLVTTFKDTPQQPFSKFTLSFRPGAAAPLITPPTCGTYSAAGELTPWSAPLEPRLLSSPPFQITEGTRESACPAGGTPPFHPTVVSGTENNAGGSYSPFYLRIERQDGEQELTKFSTVMPPGLSGNLTGIPFCPDAGIEAARAREHAPDGGREEAEHPSCPAASEIGHSITDAGVGTVLAQTPGKLYLAGPYHGAPLSLVSITSATVGPFDLGTVVIRFALSINPLTAQVEVSGAQSDPIPHILDGIIVHVRNIRAYIDREHFMLNPTSCDPMTIDESITGAGANPADPADQDTVPASAHFQAADCSSLAFKPDFKVSTGAHTSREQGASLHVNVSYPHGSLGSQTNLRSVKVDLPRQLPSRLTTLQKACPHVAFEANPASCPAESVVGHAVVHTQLIPVPLTGPAYFVSYGGEEFPKLIIVLQGYGVTIDLVGNTFIKHGVTSSTFRSTPDTPFESFELTFPEGKFSALAANGNLCTAGKTITVKKRVKRRVHGRLKTVTVRVKKKGPGLVMPIALTGQNGAVIHQNTPVSVTGCPKAHKKAKKGRKKK